jgi:predicted nucleic-acid-binding Zn-ribbon protein
MGVMSDQEPSLICPKCRSEMEVGFLADRGDGDAKYQSVWVRGVPEPGFLGLTPKVWGRAQIKVLTYRCTRCGYLESYANDAAR